MMSSNGPNAQDILEDWIIVKNLRQIFILQSIYSGLSLSFSCNFIRVLISDLENIAYIANIATLIKVN